MRDHFLRREDGTCDPVAALPSAELADILASGVELVPPFDPGETAEDVLERVRIELTARALGLSPNP